MSKERELLQTALGILEDYEWGYGGDHHKSPEASILNDIRKLLAQPEQPEFKYSPPKVCPNKMRNGSCTLPDPLCGYPYCEK